MRKNSTILPISLFSLGDRDAGPMFRSIAAQLRLAILSGRLKPGTRLPATRELANELKVSRNTILGAYDELFSEGYLEGIGGSGTFVASSLPEEMLNVAKSVNGKKKEAKRQNRLSKRGQAMAALVPETGSRFLGPVIPFRSSTPDLNSFPFGIWTKLLNKYSRNPSPDLVGSVYAAGLPRLRETIARYLRSARAVQCEAEQVIVVSGGQMSLDIVLQMLLDPGDRVLVEHPGYFGMRGVATRSLARLIQIPVDSEGFSIKEARERGEGARMIYVTPSFQYPLGVTMSLARRLELLEWARETGAWIIEDDYDGELRYSGRPIPSLQGLGNDGRVIYMGTFSKVMFPSLRVGYLIAPPGLAEAFTKGRVLADLTAPTIIQAAVADFIEGGHFERHLRRMRKLYAARQTSLIEETKANLSGLLEIEERQAGMHLIGWLPEGVDDQAASTAAWDCGIIASPLSGASAAPLKRGGLILGYTAFNERQIRGGVKQLRAALRELKATR